MTTFLDTNAIIALLDNNHLHNSWAVQTLMARKALGPAVLSDIVYCEISVAMVRREDVDEAIIRLGLDRADCSDDALFRAGKAFKRYREVNSGPKLGVMPDFIIGAIAESENVPLMTLNTKDFADYFKIELISP